MLVPKKSFGQHFLRSSLLAAQMVDQIMREKTPDESVFEIGPGTGALTRPLLERLGQLSVIEIDPRLTEFWKDQAGCTVYSGDVLAFDFNLLPNLPRCVVGNLPYNVSVPILLRLLQMPWIQRMYLMFQSEVAHRLVSKPGGRQYGRLSAWVQYHCLVEICMEIEPIHFFPSPKVHSSWVRLLPRKDQPYLRDKKNLMVILKSLFANRRKKIFSALNRLSFKKPIAQLGVNPSLRAEQLDLTVLCALANALNG